MHLIMAKILGRSPRVSWKNTRNLNETFGISTNKKFRNQEKGGNDISTKLVPPYNPGTVWPNFPWPLNRGATLNMLDNPSIKLNVQGVPQKSV